MKYIYFICLFVGLFGLSFESCSIHIFQKEFCTAVNGVTIPPGGTLKITEKCLDCSCSTGSAGQAVMSCCGYGIYAGPMIPQQGCKVITEDDGCTPKFVLVADESKLCTRK